MVDFNNESVNLDVLKQRAFNQRWAEQDDGVLPLTAADSDFPCAPEIVEAIVDYAKAGYFSYTPKRGMESFKQSIASALKTHKNEPVDPEYVLPIDSAARAMSVIAKAFLKPGDEAIVFDPVDYLFKTSMEAAGAKIILYPATVRDGKIDLSDLECYITPKTKMLGLCNPHNPLGMCYSLEDLNFILRLSEKYGFYIMNDEIWSDIIFSDAKFHSILELGKERNKRTLSVYGFSKSYGVAGLRIGCAYSMDSEIYEQLVAASEVDSTIGGISSLSQIAGIACLDKCRYWLEGYLSTLQSNRDYALERLQRMPLISCYKPQATFVLYVDISQLGMIAEDFTNLLRTQYKLALVPGGPKFFGPGSEYHLRICLATSREILEEGMNRLDKALNDIQQHKAMTL